MSWRQVGFPRTDLGIVSQHESEIILRPGSSFSLLEVNIWGLLFYATEIDGKGENYPGVHLNRFLGQLLVFLKHAQSMVGRFGYIGPLFIEMNLEGICGAQWIFFEHNQAQSGPVSDLDENVSISISSTTEDLSTRFDGVARDLLRFVFFAMNWPDLAESESTLNDAIYDGYSYNRWERPGKLDL